MSTNPAPIPPPLTLAVSTEDDATIVKCTGRLTSGLTDILSVEVKKLIPSSKRIVLDLTDLTYMDSMGLGTVIRLYVSAKAAGTSLELINLSRRVRELLGMTNLLSVFETCGEHNIKFG